MNHMKLESLSHAREQKISENPAFFLFGTPLLFICTIFRAFIHVYLEVQMIKIIL